jgi:hypothetical protein
MKNNIISKNTFINNLNLNYKQFLINNLNKYNENISTKFFILNKKINLKKINKKLIDNQKDR